MISVIVTLVCLKHTRVTTSETTVTAAKKTVSVAPTMVSKVLSIGFLIVEQNLANPDEVPKRIAALKLRPILPKTHLIHFVAQWESLTLLQSCGNNSSIRN